MDYLPVRVDPRAREVYTRGGGGGEGVKEGKGREQGRRVALCRAKVIKVSHVPG